MTNIPIPLAISEQISNLAARRAREGLQRRHWSPRAQESIHPAPAEGQVGIRTALHYLHIQNRGFGPFLMTSLEGRVIPLRTHTGAIMMIRVRGVGQPGPGFQNRKYDPPARPVWRRQRWRHPGIRPERFMENAISQAILETRPDLQHRVMMVLGGEEE